MEVLIQWPLIDDKNLSDLYFMAQVESMGLGEKVNQLILKKALSQYSQWGQKRDFKLHLNLMLENMLSKEFSNILKKELKFHGVKASNIVLEIQEPALKMTDQKVAKSLKNLRSQGLLLSIKNFGGHGAGLLLIKETSIQKLKLDPIFSKDLTHSMANQAIIKAANVFCHHLGLTMTVDGIDDEQYFNTLMKLDVHRYQGMAYSPALKEEEIAEALLRLK